MKIKWLRKIVMAKWVILKMIRFLNVTADIVLYAVCYSFLIILAVTILHFAIKVILVDEVVQCYILGIMILLATGLSITYINKFNKKYKKNDSNPSKRQNDFLFETTLFGEEKRKIDRRNME